MSEQKILGQRLRNFTIWACGIYACLLIVVGISAQTAPSALTVVSYSNITASSKLDGCDPTHPCIDNRSQFTKQSSQSSYRAIGTGTWSVDMQYADNLPTGWVSFGSTAQVNQALPSGIGYGIGPSSIQKPYHDYIRFVMTGNVTIMNYSGTQKFWWLPSVAAVAFPITPAQGGSNTTSVMLYGATGNGTTNDTTSVQAAINARGTAGGGTVSFPFGSYLVDGIIMKSGVALSCAAGTTFLAHSDNETMFTVGQGKNGPQVEHSGIIGNGGYCFISGNGHAGFQGIQVNTETSPEVSSTSHTFQNIEIDDAVIGVDTQDTFFDLFENVRVFLPTVAGFQFEVNTTALNCINCSVISTLTPPALAYCFLIHNGGAMKINGTCEGTVTTTIYQEDDIAYKVYHEDTGDPSRSAPWVSVGTSTGTLTQGINLSGSTFGVGADYGVEVFQVFGLQVNASAFSTAVGAFEIVNSGLANNSFRGLDFRANNYNINGAGFDPATILKFQNIVQNNDLSNNISSDVVNSQKFSGALNNGSVQSPPPASMQAGESTVYVNATNGMMQNQYKSTLLDDVTSCGTPTTGVHKWRVTITALGTPDTIRWQEDSGSFTTGVSLTGSCQTMSSGVGFIAAATTGHGLWESWIINEDISNNLTSYLENTQSVVASDCFYFDNIPGQAALASRASGSLCAGASAPVDAILSAFGGTEIVGRPGVEMRLGGFNGSTYTDNIVQFPQIAPDSSTGTYTRFVCSDSTGHFVTQATACH